MKTFPNEILKIIFSYLSQKYVSRCGFVCKDWYRVTRTPIFYQKIIIYTLQQYTQFLKTATEVKLTNHHHYIRFYVRQFVFDCWKENDDNDDVDDGTIGKGIINGHVVITNPHFIEQLNQMFPNIQYINDIPLFDTVTILPTYLLHLKEMKLWCSKREKDWRKRNYQQLYGLELDLFSAHQKKMIQLHIEQLEEGGEEDEYHHHHHHHHHGIVFRKIISFSIDIKNVQILYLDFGNVMVHEFDERTLDNIHLACPTLASLTLNYFDMELSDHFLHDHHHHHSLINPSPILVERCPTLQALHLKNCYLRHPFCFYYLSSKYPNISSLSLHTSYFYYPSDDEGEDDDDEETMDHPGDYHPQLYRCSLMYMITSSHQLKHLRLFMDVFGEKMIMDWNHSCWPNQELLQWFTLHPMTLKSLDYPFDLNTMEYNTDDNDGDDIGSMNNVEEIEKRTAYLDHLTSLTLRRMESSASVLHYLLRKGHRITVSKTITSLSLHGGSKLPTCFPLYDWLSSFPNLKKICLSYMELIQHTNKDHHGSLFYSLKELDLKDIKLYTRDGLSDILHHCPSVNTLLLDNIELLHPSSSPISLPLSISTIPFDKHPNFKLQNAIYINGSHLVLDKLYMNDIYYFDPHLHRTMNTSPGTIILIVKEIGSDHVLTLEKKCNHFLSNDLIFTCQSVDVVKFSSH